MPSAHKFRKPDEYDSEDIDDEELPDVIDPYETLGVTSDVSEDDIKKAYRKAALANHPDKVPESEKENATETFKKVAFAYAILSDPMRRKLYDTTGRTDEAAALDDDFSWSDYYRECFADFVTTENIDNFLSGYKGSDEERQAILDAYTKFQGDIGKIYTVIMGSDILEDDARFRKIINAAIENKEVKGYPKYVNETEKSKQSRIKNAEKAAKKAEEHFKSKGGKETGNKDKPSGSTKKKDGNMGDLAALIQGKQNNRGSAFLDRLAEKYSASEGKKSKKRAVPAMDEPPEEAFEKNRKKAKKT